MNEKDMVFKKFDRLEKQILCAGVFLDRELAHEELDHA